METTGYRITETKNMITICCIQVHNYCGLGKKYVENLYDMIQRNTTIPFRFIVFTDEPLGYSENIETQTIPYNLIGWWNKLYLFRENLFPENERIVFFDLDTLITGPLDDILSYNGEFALLYNHFHPEHPKRWQSSVMMWRSGFGHHLWHNWLKKNRPDVPGGDQMWIMKQQQVADILQELFPDKFISYKVNNQKPPKTESVVFFHGRPRPHEEIYGWVPKVWQIGGWGRKELDKYIKEKGY